MGKPHHSQLSEINHVCVHAAAPRSPQRMSAAEPRWGVYTHLCRGSGSSSGCTLSKSEFRRACVSPRNFQVLKVFLGRFAAFSLVNRVQLTTAREAGLH